MLTFFTPCTVTTKDFTVRISGYPKKLEMEQQQITVQSSEEETQLSKPNMKPGKLGKIQLVSHKDHNKNFIGESNKINELKSIANSIDLQNEQQGKKIKLASISIGSIALVIGIATIITIIKCRNSKPWEAGRTTDNQPTMIKQQNRLQKNRTRT